jgi:hypothetical protein
MERSEKEILKALALGYDVISTATKPVRKEVGGVLEFIATTEGHKALLRFESGVRKVIGI